MTKLQAASTYPREGMWKAFARWPNLTDSERDWAIERATAICRRDGRRLHAEADELEAELRARIPKGQ